MPKSPPPPASDMAASPPLSQEEEKSPTAKMDPACQVAINMGLPDRWAKRLPKAEAAALAKLVDLEGRDLRTAFTAWQKDRMEQRKAQYSRPSSK